MLDLAGFQSSITATQTPWDGGCWDLVFTNDDPVSRPDPVVGQLQPGPGIWYPLPLTTGTGGSIAPPTDSLLKPWWTRCSSRSPRPRPSRPTPRRTTSSGTPLKVPPYQPHPNLTLNYYFMTIGNQLPAANPNVELNPFTPTYKLNYGWDPFSSTWAPTGPLLPGVLPPPAVGGQSPTTYPAKPILNGAGPGSGVGQYFWVCLRRPANPFAAVSVNNPMIVVDAMRFPFIEGGGTAGTPPNLSKAGQIFSYQRLQPFRGGHAVPVPGVPTAIDPRYGYSEQIAVPTHQSMTVGQYGGQPITNLIYNTLGLANDGTLADPGNTTPPNSPYLNELWDYFPFIDRDFTSVAELLMVPGCPPGLFTKQFTEFAPSSANVTGIFSKVAPVTSPLGPTPPIQLPAAPAAASQPFNGPPPTFPLPPPPPPMSYQLTPHTFPYLVDKFFYTGASPTPGATPLTPLFGDPTGDGWFKMFEFFEVPSQMIGAVGPVAQGTNFDWLRQDTKPGLINLNLIIDEEVFFSVFGKQNTQFNTPQLRCTSSS